MHAQLAASWQRVHDACARSSVAAWETRVLDPASSLHALARHSPAHLALKRPPTAAGAAASTARLPVVRPFNSAGFHFGKAAPQEVVARFCPASASLLPQGAAAAPEAEGSSPLLLNISPLWPGHCLFLPQVEAQHPQVATPALFHAVLALVRAMEASRSGAFAGFNSLGAHASVNHFHAHTGWAQDVCAEWAPREGGGGLPCLRAPPAWRAAAPARCQRAPARPPARARRPRRA